MHAPPAVVAGLDLNGLGLLRALGQAGVPVIGLDTDLKKPTAQTRFGRKVHVRALSGQAFVDDLLALRETLSGDPVLILTQEASVATVSAMREALSGSYRLTMPDRQVVEDLLDKARFQALASSQGSPIPRAVRIDAQDDIGAVRSLRFPCVVKPATKSTGFTKRFGKAYRMTAFDDVLRAWPLMQELAIPVIVQEWIEGEDSDVYFCLQYRAQEGRAVSFSGRKLCQWPVLVGGTASCIPAPEAAEELIALTDAFFGRIGFCGLGSMEYKRDRRDGRFYMVEPTVGRTDYQQEIASLNGVNIPLAAYLDALGRLSSFQQNVVAPKAWRDPLGYANALKAGAKDVTPSGIALCDAYFRMNDPMPYIALKRDALRARLFGSRS
jgi:predicted ATP-grasp superfamily ATP-dependent carboligase